MNWPPILHHFRDIDYWSNFGPRKWGLPPFNALVGGEHLYLGLRNLPHETIDTFLSRTVQKAFRYLELFRRDSRLWRTDGRTDKRTDLPTACPASLCSAVNKSCKLCCLHWQGHFIEEISYDGATVHGSKRAYACSAEGDSDSEQGLGWAAVRETRSGPPTYTWSILN